ncbi:MAG: hypothetical protein NTZ03_10735 [Actinobacteria bacterium]|nr:hypothetical protein [Actinomycetota bacterium]
MFCARGWRLPYTHFREAHAFDLRRGTDTATRLAREQYDAEGDTFEHSTFYGAAWTSVIEQWFDWVAERVGPELSSRTFVDIGCGKGKVLIVWAEKAARSGASMPICGIEYYAPLADIARSNIEHVGLAERIEVITADALNVDPEVYGRRPVVFLFNPFDADVMRPFIERVAALDPLVIYANPVHGDVFEQRGFNCLHETSGWHNGLLVRAYERTATSD